MGIDPNTGLDDGEDFQAQIARNVAQARGAGIPIQSSLPSQALGPQLVDPAGAQRAVQQARSQGVPPMLASPAAQGPGLGSLIPGMQGQGGPLMSIFPPQPARREVERSTTASTRREMGKEEKAAVGDLSQAYDDQIAAGGRLNSAKVNTAIVDADNADALAIQHEAKARRKAELFAQGETQLKDAMTLYKAQFDKYRSLSLDELTTKDVAKAAFAGLAMGLGELGKLRPGGENVTATLVMQAVQQDFLRQKASLEHQKDILLQAGENVDVVQKWHTYAQSNLDIKEAAAYDAIVARNTANLKAVGVPEAEAQADMNNAILRAAKAEKIQSVFEGTRRTIQSTVEKQLVENTGMGGAAGGLTPYQQYQVGRQVEADKEKDEQRLIQNWDGKQGLAPTPAEGKQLREMRGTAQTLDVGLEGLQSKVSSLGFLDRMNPWSDAQQNIAGELDVMLAPMTQNLGAGAPQDKEAARKLRVMGANAMQNQATAAKNIQAMRDFLKNHLDQRFNSTDLGSIRQGAAKPAAAPATGGPQIPAGAKKGKFNGKPAWQLPDGSVIDAATGQRLE